MTRVINSIVIDMNLIARPGAFLPAAVVVLQKSYEHYS